LILTFYVNFFSLAKTAVERAIESSEAEALSYVAQEMSQLDIS